MTIDDERWRKLQEESSFGTNVNLELKNGAIHIARPAYIMWRRLSRLNELNPSVITKLMSLARHGPNSLDATDLDDLKEKDEVFFDKHGAMTQTVRDVIESAVRETPEGLVVANPFQIRTSEDVELIQKLAESDLRALELLIGIVGQSPDDKGRA